MRNILYVAKEVGGETLRQKALDLIRKIRSYREDVHYRAFCRKIANSAQKHSCSNWVIDPKTRFWAHAGSGILHLYGNSQEAFDDAIERGFGVIEADVMMTSDGVPVMSHRFRPNNEVEFDSIPTVAEFLSVKINGRFTPMTLEDFIKRYSNSNVYVSIDPSPSIRADELGRSLITFLEARAPESFLKKVIYQINGLGQLEMMGKHNPFGALHYGIDAEFDEARNSWKVDSLVPALNAVGVQSVSISDFPIEDEDKVKDILGLLIRGGIVPVIVGVNSTARLSRWHRLGVAHINTDFVEP